MDNNLSNFYNESFYNNLNSGAFSSATIVLELLYKFYKPLSVIDIGCGQGAWLAAAETMGSKELKGMDGEWVEQEKIISQNINFEAVNFDDMMPTLDRKFDLCISLEVAEHLSEASAKPFINFLCSASEVVLFSAAIKGQGGTNHINEQWQSYWIDLFQSNDYKCLDFLRGLLWNNSQVEWWYKQNLFLFIAENSLLDNLGHLSDISKPITNVVHPELYEQKIGYLQSCIDSYRKKEINHQTFDDASRRK